MIGEVEAPKTDFYLKLASEASMPSVLSAFYDDEVKFVSNTVDYAIDVVGVLYEATGVTITNDDGMEYPEMSALDGWHVNIRILSDNAFLNYAVETLDDAHGVTPVLPHRKWL